MATVNPELIIKAVRLGQVIRRNRAAGNLQSLAPPTIYGYQAFVRMATALPHLSLQQVALATLLGNASAEDSEQIRGVFNEVFGMQATDEDDPMKGSKIL